MKLVAAGLVLAAICGPASAVDLPAMPGPDGIESWTCRAGREWDGHFRSMLEAVVRNSRDTWPQDMPDNGTSQPHFHIFWQQQRHYAAEVALVFGPLDLSAESLPAPKSLEFGTPGPRIRSGTLRLTAGDGRSFDLPVKGHVKWLGRHMAMNWVRITEPDTLQAIVAADGWSLVHHGRIATDKGALRLPSRAAIAQAHASAREELVEKMKNPQANCQANPIDQAARDMAEI